MFDVAGQVLVGVLLADLASGVAHWALDRIDWPSWAWVDRVLVGRNRAHHADQVAFAHLGLWERNRTTWAFTAFAGGVLAWFCGPAVWIAAAVAAGLAVNEVHVWAHVPERAPRPVRVLQRAGVLQSPPHHARHHRGRHDRHYCILTNLLNPVLDACRVWAGLERVLAVAGVRIWRGA